MKMIFQHEENDCGAAALAMIFSYYGSKIPMAVCRQLTNTDKDGTSFYGIIDGAKKCGIIGTPLTGSYEELKDEITSGRVRLPIIAHTVIHNSKGHFLVISKITAKHVYVYDPAKGKRKLSVEQFCGEWTGNVISFCKSESYAELNLNRGIWSKFIILLKPHVLKLAVVVLLSLFVAALGILTAFLFQTIVDNFGVTSGYYVVDEVDDGCGEEHSEGEHIDDESENLQGANIFERLLVFIDNESYEYRSFFIAAIILYVIQGMIQFLRTVLVTNVSKKVDMNITMLYYIKSINLPMISSVTRKTGEYLSRFSDTSIIRDAIVGVTVNVFLDTCIAIGYGVILCSINLKMFTVACMVLLLYGLVIWGFHKPLEKINRNVMENAAQTESFLKESYDGTELVKTLSVQQYVINSLKKVYNKLLSFSVKKTLIVEAQDVIADTVEMVGSVIIMWIGFSMVIKGEVTIGSLLSFFIMLNYFTSPVKSLITLQPTIQSAVIAADRLNDILLLKSEQEQNEEKINSIEERNSWNKQWKRIKYNNVNFQYGNNGEVLKNINFIVNRGEHVAIVGESGSGKTTIAKMLVSLYHPVSGQIYLDSLNIESLYIEEIRKHAAFVNQEAYLFSNTIYNNIVMGRDGFSQEDIDEACKNAEIYDTIQQFSYGYQFNLNENGNNLSAGQRQRIALSRSLLSKPEILILDEATSSLDLITEGKVISNLFKNYESMTVIMIAHRLQSLVDFDKIIVVKDGEIVEQGNHKELLNLNGEYKRMWQNN